MTHYPAELYVATHTGTPGDVTFYQESCISACSVLELGCGDARMLSQLHVQGRRLVGLDCNEELLERAEDRLRQHPTSPAIELIRGDMQRFQLNEQFERIIIPYSGLYCLPDATALRDCLNSIWDHLPPGGQLVLDTYAADGFHEQRLTEDGTEDEYSEIGTLDIGNVRYEVSERNIWNRAEQTIDARYRYQPTIGDSIEVRLPQRYILASQLRDLAATTGFELMDLWGGFDQRPYDPAGSDLMVFRATKPLTA